MMSWFELIGAAIAGGGLTKLFDLMIIKEKNHQSDEDRMVSLILSDNKRLREECEKLRKALDDGKKEADQQRQEMLEEIINLKADQIRLQAKVAELEQDLTKYKNNHNE